MRIDVEAYQRVLGDELRAARKNLGWTRKELNEKLQSEISLQTLATYELGTRQCSVVRLAEICLAMGVQPHDLLARVHTRLFGTPSQVRLNLRHIVDDEQPELLPLRRWATARLRQPATSPEEIHLDPPALERMAELCGLTTADLLARLRALSGELSPPTA
ncbi:MAG: helix-turn-helix domain-containing protein [Haloechinothrix sp.]